jgi:hypothetical protein
MKTPSPLKNLRMFLSLGLLLALPLSVSAFALPPEQPYFSDCAQPWEKPDNSASDYEMRGWFQSADRYVRCLYSFQQQAESNANEFVRALNALATELEDKQSRNELTQDDYDVIKAQYDRYDIAIDAWIKALKDTQEEKEEFVRRNGLTLEK